MQVEIELMRSRLRVEVELKVARATVEIKVAVEVEVEVGVSPPIAGSNHNNVSTYANAKDRRRLVQFIYMGPQPRQYWY